MKKRYLLHYILGGLLLGAGLFTGCDDDDKLGDAPRLFRPIIDEVTCDGNRIKITWNRLEGSKNYIVGLSQDSFKTAPIQSFEVDTTFCLFENLEWEEKYQIAVQAFGDNNIKSEVYTLTGITTAAYPTKLLNPETADVIDVAARVRWTISEDIYTRLIVTKNDEPVKTIQLTAEEYAKGETIITGLDTKTTYRVIAYTGDEYKGRRSYTTVAAQNFEGAIVDLRELNAEDSYGMLTQAYIDKLASEHPNGVTVVLSGGTKYEIKTILFSTDITFVTGLSLNGYSEMAVFGNFGSIANKKVDNISFEKIFFTDHPDKLKTSGNYGATYAFNFNVSGAKVGNLSFNSCDIKYKRGFIRMQTTAEIDKVEINNCVIDSIADYGVINNGNDASYIGDIVIKNSTIANADKVLVCGKKLGVNSITMENVTTYNSPKSAAYFLDYDKNTVPGGIKLNGCLLGAGNGNVNGIRSACNSITVSNCYKASDLTWFTAEGAAAPTAPIEDAVDCKLTTKVLFKAPETGDFTITDNSLISNKVGDPRWY